MSWYLLPLAKEWIDTYTEVLFVARHGTSPEFGITPFHKNVSVQCSKLFLLKKSLAFAVFLNNFSDFFSRLKTEFGGVFSVLIVHNVTRQRLLPLDVALCHHCQPIVVMACMTFGKLRSCIFLNCPKICWHIRKKVSWQAVFVKALNVSKTWYGMSPSLLW